ncbi:unnamed protein product [Dovyalis caffra]|uniref:Uncharacterized protein n=1 Tax=Dovyalis caffra TaxID=77055 RepID=A0AAV1SFN9_9ROSI|nr:unnamed protein product [Dovyalis caffra]
MEEMERMEIEDEIERSVDGFGVREVEVKELLFLMIMEVFVIDEIAPQVQDSLIITLEFQNRA